METQTIRYEGEGERVDVYLARQNPQLTRSYLKKLCDDGLVHVNAGAAKASLRLRQGDEVQLTLPPPAPIEAQAEDIPLDIVYEDAYLAVVNKQRGLVVHPAAGNYSGTLVNALLYAVEDLSGVNGALRPGIVHRIDKDTTGLLVVAKNDEAHKSLAQQIKTKSASRLYYALVEGNIKEDSGRVDAPIGRDRHDRKRMAVDAQGKSAATTYRVLERFGDCTLVECALETGRTHQIRVHMKHIGHPVCADTLYGYKHNRFKVEGQLLHAHRLTLRHPKSGEVMSFEAPLPEDFRLVLEALRAVHAMGRTIIS